MKDLIREVSMIKHTVNNIERKLDNLISSGINQHSTDDEQQPILRQPFESLEEFKEFDAALCNDDKSSLVSKRLQIFNRYFRETLLKSGHPRPVSLFIN